MRVIVLSLVLLAACTGHHVTTTDGSAAMRTCTGAAYDPCTMSDQCNSLNCHNYNASMLEVCTQTCTPGNNTTCPVDSTGANGFCNMMGNCKPAKANSCTP
jgi:hypothetical protein